MAVSSCNIEWLTRCCVKQQRVHFGLSLAGVMLSVQAWLRAPEGARFGKLNARPGARGTARTFGRKASPDPPARIWSAPDPRTSVRRVSHGSARARRRAVGAEVAADLGPPDRGYR